MGNQKYVGDEFVTLPFPALRAGRFGRQDLTTAIGTARGSVKFNGNPSAGQTVVLNGVTWTFVASGAAGTQSNIGTYVEDTVAALVTALNASVNTSIDDATYTSDDNVLFVTHDTAGAAGDGYTLAAGTADVTLSGATLRGGAIAVSLDDELTVLTISGAANVALTLAAGEQGQRKSIVLAAKGSGNAVLTPSAIVGGIVGGTTLTFDAANEACNLIYLGNTWHVLANTATLA